MKKLLATIVLLLAVVAMMAAAASADEVTEVYSVDELVNALSANGTGGSIRLGTDITLTGNLFAKKDAILDLNGHTLNTAAYTLVIYSNMTIKDSYITETGKIIGTGSFKIQVGSSTVPGQLVFESGNLDTSKSYGIRVPSKGKLTVNGGSLRAPGYVIYDEGNVTVNGGTVTATGTSPAVQVKGPAGELNEMLTVTGGKIETLGDGKAINLYSNCAVTISGGTIEALYPDPEQKNGGIGVACFKNTRLTINGGTIKTASFGIMGNGTDSGTNDGTGAWFIITGGTVISAYGTAVFAPQADGETVISGGTITGGRSGVDLRAGTLTISGGTITGNREEFVVDEVRNGSLVKGCAVSVVQHSTKKPVTVRISGGTFYGKVPFHERNVLNNPAEAVAQINYDISGGVFHSSGTKTVEVEDYPNGKFIQGGKFTHYVTDYVKDGYGEKIENDPVRPEPNMKAVYRFRTVTVAGAANGKVKDTTRYQTVSDDGTTVEREPDGQEPVQAPDSPKDLCWKALYGDKFFLRPEPDEGYDMDTVTVTDENGNAIDVTAEDGGWYFLMPDSDVTVKVTFVSVKYYFVSGDGSEWIKGSGVPLDFVVKGTPNDDKTFARFTGIETDGKAVNTKDYDASAGSVKLSLKPAYLEGLDARKHTLRAVFSNGSVTGSFTVKAADKPLPKTGDPASLVLWCGLILLGIAGIITAAACRSLRKKRR